MAIVRAVNAAYAAEAKWISEHPVEAETLNQQDAGYSDAVRDTLVKLKRRWDVRGVQDAKFLQEFQKASDWLSERKILPQKAKVTDYLARL